MKLAVIDPGTDGRTADRAAGDRHRRARRRRHARRGGHHDRRQPPTDDSAKATGDELALQAAAYTPKPQIFSRAQWGADESMRDASSLHYYEVHAGFVHHTVNANDYTRAEVPALHPRRSTPTTRSRGAGATSATTSWSTGSVGSGRAGTAASTAPSSAPTRWATTTTRSRCRRSATSRPRSPPDAMLRRLRRAVRLEAVAARCRRRRDPASGSAPPTFQAINGHRDAASTACPGRYLYAKLPVIRALRRGRPGRTGPGRDRQTDLASTGRRPTWWSAGPATAGRSSSRPAALTGFRPGRQVSTGWTAARHRGGHPGPDRGRQGRPRASATPTAVARVIRRATATAASATRSRPTSLLRRPRPGHRRRRPRRGRSPRPGRPRHVATGELERLPAATARAGFARRSPRQRLVGYRHSSVPATWTATARATWSPSTRRAPAWLRRRHRRRSGSARPADGRQLRRVRRRHRLRRLQPATAGPTCSCARTATGQGAVLPGPRRRRLRPPARARSVRVDGARRRQRRRPHRVATAPDLVGRRGGTLRPARPTPAPSRPAAPIDTGMNLGQGRPHPQRRRLGPRRPRRRDRPERGRPATSTCTAATAAASFGKAGPRRQRLRRGPAARRGRAT